ncbi:gamma-aminobutyric acid receptor subunit beta-like [Brevipalpus obovatus]|uniref:gamma-aminobutyric acid receptor subunit beta-like n=1 Tax=Brevipalpus obovatus TaxID=246614 RepID=UPI003D9EBB51
MLYLIQFVCGIIIILLNSYTCNGALNCDESTKKYRREVSSSSPYEEKENLGDKVTQILDSFFGDNKYDKRVRPNYGGEPVTVNVSVHILSISSVSEVQMDFTSDFYFRQRWKDPRLVFPIVTYRSQNISALSVGAEVADKLWLPDTFFANEKQAFFHEATTKNTFLRINHNGDVLLSLRLTVTSSCPMNLQYFPMDRQQCTIEVESYGFSTDEIRFSWTATDAVRIEQTQLPQFEILDYTKETFLANTSTGVYSRLVLKIYLVRSMGYYMIQIYVPASLIVIISWVSFWLHRNATPARVHLGVITVLTMTTLMSSTNSQLPKISYVKSIDVFLGTCFVMVFAALLEYAAVGYIGKRISMRKNRFQQLMKAAEEKRRKQIASEEMITGGGVGVGVGVGGGVRGPPVPDMVHNRLGSGRSEGRISTCDDGTNIHGIPSASGPEQAMGRPNIPTVASSGVCGAVSVGSGSGGSGGLSDESGGRCPRTDGGVPMDPHHLAHYATLRRPLLDKNYGSCRGSVPPSRQPYLSQRPQEVRLEMVGSKMTSAVAQSPPIEGGHPQRLSGSVGRLPAQFTYMNRLTNVPPKNLNSLFGVSPSDIDKYSRVVFPVCFVCFNLMYWIIFLHISRILDPVAEPASS